MTIATDDPARDWRGRFTLVAGSRARRDPAAGPAWTSALSLCDELMHGVVLEIDPAPRTGAGTVRVAGRYRVGSAVRRLTAQLPSGAGTAVGTLTGVRAGSSVQIRLWAGSHARLLTVLGHEPGTPDGQVQRFRFVAVDAPVAPSWKGEPDPLPPPRPTAPAVPDWIAHEIVLCTNRLRGAVLSQQQNAFDRDYSGGSTYHERSSTIRFAGDRYRREDRSFSRVSAAGLSASSPRHATSAGTWEVVPGRIGARLLLRSDDGIVHGHDLSVGTRAARLDDEVWTRTT